MEGKCRKCYYRKWKALKSFNHGGRIGTEFYCVKFGNFKKDCDKFVAKTGEGLK